MLYLFRVLLLTSCQRINLPHLKTYHYSWVTFNSKNQRSSKKLSLDQNTTRQWEWVRFTIPGDNTTLMGFRNCLCLTGLFGLSLVTLFMKLSLKKTKKQVKSVLCVLDNRTFKKKTSLLFILRYMHSTWQLKSQHGCYLKWRRGGAANLKSHAYSHVKVGQPDSWRCFKVFQLYSSVTHFVLCKALLGEGSYVLQKTPFNMCLWQAISPLASSAVICVFELVHNKKVVLSLKKYHYFSFSCSKLISASSTTEDRVLVQLQLW